jgi:hypothetical protein
MRIISLLLNSNVTVSISESRRLLEAGRVSVGLTIIKPSHDNPNPEIILKDGDLVTIGKSTFKFIADNNILEKV